MEGKDEEGAVEWIGRGREIEKREIKLDCNPEKGKWLPWQLQLRVT